jgi:rhodanese-related sulfurtransferase
MFRMNAVTVAAACSLVVLAGILAPLPAFGAEPSAILSKQQICQEAKATVAHISPSDLQGRILAREKFLLLDIRTRAEYEAGHIVDAVWLPRGFLEFKIADLTTDPDAEIIVYCLKGCRSSRAVMTLQEMGYRNVTDLDGGTAQWLKQGFPLWNQYGEIEVVDFVDRSPFQPVRKDSERSE